MNILVTGANGFVGKNLIANLNNIKNGKNKNVDDIKIDEIYEYDLDKELIDLEEYCRSSDFVFHLAGVNRTSDADEFMTGNLGFSETLLKLLKKYHNTCPIMVSSSIQATLSGRYNGSDYGKSKLAGENLFFSYEEETGTKVFIYRFPNLFGKWCRPNYNSVIATFCNNIARDLPIRVDDRTTELELLYIDDLVFEMLNLLSGKPHRCNYEKTEVKPEPEGQYCYVPDTYKVTLGEIVDLLKRFRDQPRTLNIPSIPYDSFSKKLYSTYLSYLPADKVAFPLNMNVDERGSFTEILKTADKGQVSVNISLPGVTKGNHWHNTKWEFFVVVSGRALIQQRNLGSDEILEFEVSGEHIKAVHMLPGYTHNIKNRSETEPLITIMWANEPFDENNPDTFSEKV